MRHYVGAWSHHYELRHAMLIMRDVKKIGKGQSIIASFRVMIDDCILLCNILLLFLLIC
jgi:hypothetical protein